MVNERLQTIKRMADAYLKSVLEHRDYAYREVLDAMDYSLSAGGKRIRPALTLAFGKLCGVAEETMLPVACALEMVHTYSLIHDDLPCMDDDDLRRGQPSCHKKFGEATALLAGDALLTMAFEQIAMSDLDAQSRIKAVSILANAAGAHGMIGGQVLDLAHEGQAVTLQQLDEINRLKTSALIQAACLLGCITSTDSAMTQVACVYAQNIGLAFQIVDDILDVVGDQNTLGKPIGSDVEQQKTTYVALLGVERCREIATQLTEEACAALQTLEGDTSFLQTLAKKLIDRQN